MACGMHDLSSFVLGRCRKKIKREKVLPAINRYLLTEDKNLGTLLPESGMEFSVVDTGKQKTFLSTFTLHLSTFLHLTVPHHSHFLGSC